LHHNSKYSATNDIDRVKSVEIAFPIQNLKLHHHVKEHPIHGPCGVVNKSFPCMKNGKCSCFYPKKYQSITTILEDGFLTTIEETMKCVVKNHISLDNRGVV